MDYTEIAAEVLDAIQEDGMVMTLRKQTAGIFNPAAGEYDIQTITDYTVQGLIKSQSLTITGNVGQRFNGNVEVQIDDQFVMLAASGLTATPAVGDLLLISGVAYSIKALIPLKPGGVVLLYQTLVRK